MGLNKCEKCGEQVDDSKAFCPECGNPFVDEKTREDSSEFDKYAGTVNLTKSTYNLMLSEMQLKPSQPIEPKITPQPAPEPQPERVIAAVPEPTEPDQNPQTAMPVRVLYSVVGVVILLTLLIAAVYLLVSYFRSSGV